MTGPDLTRYAELLALYKYDRDIKDPPAQAWADAVYEAQEREAIQTEERVA